MKKGFERLIGLALTLILLFSLCSENLYAREYTFTSVSANYMEGKDTPGLIGELYVARPNSKKITKAKTDDKSVVTVVGLDNFNKKVVTDWTGYNNDLDGNKVGSDYSYGGTTNEYYSLIHLYFKKAKSSVISYTIKGDKKAYTNQIKVEVKEYVNPTKSIKIKGVNQNKSFHKTTATYAYAGTTNPIKISSETKSSSIAIAPAKGWSIESVSIGVYDKKTGNSKSGKNISYYNIGESSVNVYLGEVSKKNKYRVFISYKNLSDGGCLDTTYYINY